MANNHEITVPDIGGADKVDVIEILVQKGDSIEKETSLITLESDKASMEIPSPKSGVVKDISLQVGDKVSEGDLILTLEDSEQIERPTQASMSSDDDSPANEHSSANDDSKSETQTINVPDIGGAEQVDVIELLVSEGDEIAQEQSIITLESDKASMEIPSPVAGRVQSIALKVGDKVSEGDLILNVETQMRQQDDIVSTVKDNQEHTNDEKTTHGELSSSDSDENAPDSSSRQILDDVSIHAGPAVRRLAREFGVNLSEVEGSGRKSRITKEDVQQYVKAKLKDKSVSGGMQLPPITPVDFSKFGEIETLPLNKIKKLTGINVHRSWINIPHVTQFDEADITDLEAFRNQEKDKAKASGYKLTILAFVCKAIVKALQQFPSFNASLDSSGENLIYKKFFNVGVAVDTPNGLVVPVIKGVDTLTIGEIALEMGRLSTKAREKGLMPNDMSGGCFTISSLGGIGGTAFTPIVNAPEVAILGLSRAEIKPVYIDSAFVPRLKLPLSLSYDHRVIDGAQAASFTRYLAECLGDIRRILL